MKHYQQIFNQKGVKTLDLVTRVYDHGTNTPELLEGILIFKGVAKSEGLALIAYLRATAKYEKNTFTITPASNTNIGLGDGVPVADARWNGKQTLKNFFRFVAPGKYNITFPYQKKI